jgi:hypothetical protein
MWSIAFFLWVINYVGMLLLLLQVFQAYEQRLPARAVIEMTRRSAITPGGRLCCTGCDVCVSCALSILAAA